MSKNTKKPTGLSMKRDKKKIICEWKIASADHGAGQQFKYDLKYKSTKLASNSYTSLSSKTATSHKVDLADLYSNTFYPEGKKYLESITFYIKGRQKAYKKGKKTITPNWSEPGKKTVTIHEPHKIKELVEQLDSSSAVSTTFSWTSSVSDDSWYIFTDYEWQSIITTNGKKPTDHDWNTKAVTKTASSETRTDPYHDSASDTDFYWVITKGSGSVKINENSAKIYPSNTTNPSHTRWFRVRARGPAGATAWVTEKHVYAYPRRVGGEYPLTAHYLNRKAGSGFTIHAEWKVPSTDERPIDSVQVQYSIKPPKVVSTETSTRVIQTLAVPDDIEGTWTDCPGGTVTDSKGLDRFTAVCDAVHPEDNVVFVRVNTVHDRNIQYGVPVIAQFSEEVGLKKPTGLAINSYDRDTSRVEITCPKNNSVVENSYIAIFYRTDKVQNQGQCVAIIPWGQDSGTKVIALPPLEDDDDPSVIGLGMQTVVGAYSPKQTFETTSVRSYTFAGGYLMSSDLDWSSGAIQLPPTFTECRPSDTYYDSIYVEWKWPTNGGNTTGIELSWSQFKRVWDSTDEPSKFSVNKVHKSYRYITGLNPGTYYVRGRYVNNITRDGEEVTNYGAYSNTKKVKLSSIPITPVLQATTNTLIIGGKTKCVLYWSYSNDDGTKHKSSTIRVRTVNSNGSTSDWSNLYSCENSRYDHRISLDDTVFDGKIPWASESVHQLSVRVTSSLGEESAWSDPITIYTAPVLTASLTSSSITQTTVDERTFRQLTAVPITATVTSNAGKGAQASIYIERVYDYNMSRADLGPDETPRDGYEGELIATADVGAGSGTVTITNSMLLGYLDDGQVYRIVAVVKDSYGQVCKVETLGSYSDNKFEVHWAHKAIKPTATITVNEEDLVTYIRPIKPSGWVSGDVVDIYRLSADAPQLIIENGSFNTTYVDPYPTLGDFGGHRVVYKTFNGDFITSGDELAMADYNDESAVEDIQHTFAIVIDFPGGQVRLPYDVSLSNSWKKDFKETRYLGGHIQGDWNPGVSRTSSLRARCIVSEDGDTIRLIRRLADYPGHCHIRTPEGSSFVGDVEVSEEREERKINMVTSFSFEITRVGVPTLEGMTYSEWIEEQGD